MRGDRGDLAGVVGLVAADRDECVGSGGEDVGDDVLHLAGLVASEGESGVDVFAFGPDLSGAEVVAESLQRVHRARSEGERVPLVVAECHGQGPSVRRPLLRDDVYQAIRDAIVRGELTPGEQLRDTELSAWLGVSRTPIREALLRLARAGLVTAEPGRATRVTAEDPAAIADAQAVAAALQALAMSLAAPRLGPGEISRMETANGELTAALAAGDAEAAIAADDAFHAVAIEQAANPIHAEHLESVTLMLRRAEFLHFDAMSDASVQQHARIVAALRGGDAEAAAELTRLNWLTIITA